MLIFSLLLACSTESKVSALAVEYETVEDITPAGIAARWDMVCADDQAASSKEDIQEEYEKVFALDGFAAAVQTLYTPDSMSVQSAVLSEDGNEATVRIIRSWEGSDDKSFTVKLRLEDGSWCINTDAAEDAEAARLKEIRDKKVSKFNLELTMTSSWWDGWEFDRAGESLALAESILAEIGEDDEDYGQFKRALRITRDSHDAQKALWLGGRWAGSNSENPLTRKKEATAVLEGLDGIPYIGDIKNARLVFRCLGGDLDVYINAQAMLQSNYRYNSVTGKYRFGDGPIIDVTGTAGKDSKSLFFRNPETMLNTFQAHDGETWIVELNPFRQTPQVVTFDLTGSTAAVAKVKEACP